MYSQLYSISSFLLIKTFEQVHDLSDKYLLGCKIEFFSKLSLILNPKNAIEKLISLIQFDILLETHLMKIIFHFISELAS